MRTTRPTSFGAALVADTALCIGAFDGFHLGHQALLVRARELARHVAVCTFEPHPSAVLAPDRATPLLLTPAQRERTCAALGVDELALLPFDAAVAALSHEQFFRRFVADALRPSAVVVGSDFRFGHGRAGGRDDLAEACARAGIGFSDVDPVVGPDGHRVSSTRIRDLVRGGEVDRAAALLDRWYAVEGAVHHGAARGRRLGFPTANVAAENAIVPRAGVYAAILSMVDPNAEDRGRRWAAVANIGDNPTFPDAAATTTGLEVHALDVDLGDRLYGRRVEVGFVRRLRDEIAFAGADALVQAIQRDIADARPHLGPEVLMRLPPPLPPEPEGAP
jgi:riboflavin kinase/FMN adenylyltransferase